MKLTAFETSSAEDKLEGWEVIEFLQVPVQDILQAAQDLDWITEDNLEDFLEMLGVYDKDRNNDR